MYNGSYDNTESTIRIPDDYGGSVSFDTERTTSQNIYASDTDRENETTATAYTAEDAEYEFTHSENNECDTDKHISDTFGEIFNKIVKGASSEDILIIGVAAFLFFSENGDKLYALLLLILLLIR